MTMAEEPSAKRAKINNGRCEHWMQSKGRQCGMQKKAGRRFCAEHGAQMDGDTERVPCPLDPHHTVKIGDMKKHLQKCNSRPKEKDPWFSKDANLQLEESGVEADDDHDEQHYFDLLRQLEFDELPQHVCAHDGLNKKLGEVLNQKHALQQSSLIGNMKRTGQLDTKTFYMEYGCGKGELSRYVNICAMRDSEGQDKNYGFGLIDRGVNRQKADHRIMNESNEQKITPIIKRTRIDIKDLAVDRFLPSEAGRVMIISKHLCGVATDLTLCLVLKSTMVSSGRFQGMLVAMCCRHVCSYRLLLPESKRYLACMGFPTSKSFDVLKKAVSWAVSGDNDKQRAKLGLVARRIIDESRAIAMQKRLVNYQVQLFKYAEPTTTLENVCLSISPATAAT